jgi:hypothetical protein
MDPTMIAIAVSGLLFVAMLVFVDIGFRIGKKRKTNTPDTNDEGVGTVDAAVFGLLGLILAFTFSGASSRLDMRRAQIVQEANAIGTAYLRIDLLQPSEQPELRKLFKDYLESRIEVYEKMPDVAGAKAALAKGNDLQNAIWSHSVTACQIDLTPRTCGLLLPALNEMIDITTTRTMATVQHAPLVILVLMVVLSLLGALLAGFAMSPQTKRSALHSVLFALAISVSVYVVLDLEYPRAGLINLKDMDQAIVQLRQQIK